MFNVFYNAIVNNKDFLDIILQFFTVLGTVGAVIVSLVLSARKEKPRLSASLSIVGINQNMYGRYCIQRSLLIKNVDTSKLYLMVYIRNVGNRSITIQSTSFYMDLKIPNTKILFNALDAAWDPKKYPRTISDSMGAEFILQNYEDFLNNVISSEEVHKKLKNIKIFILSEAGITYKVKIHKKLLYEILNDAEKQKLKITK